MTNDRCVETHPTSLIAKEGIGHHPHSLDPPGPIVEWILEKRIKE